MWDTIIQNEHRGKGLLGELMSTLETELKKRGFKYLERNALTANNFAENISKHYNDRIIKSFPLDSRWGPQIFFRIKL
jgi:GNAT superfamily N-acetyltransferase